MNKETAIQYLNSTSIDDRLIGARYFARYADKSDRTTLSAFLAKESAKWVKRPLQQALARCGEIIAQEVSDLSELTANDSSHTLQVNAIKSKAIEEFSSLIIHELSTRIANVELDASGELPDYANSRTGKSINRLMSVLTAIEQLRSVVSQPKYTNFNLEEMVNDVVESLKHLTDGISILLSIDQPFTILADRPTLDIVFSIGLKNAIESVIANSRRDPPEIIINAGSAGFEDFLSIIDSGLGFAADPPSSSVHMGYTTKNGDHIGYGLYIAASAMRAMEGELLLSNSSEGGGKFEMRWFAEERNENPAN